MDNKFTFTKDAANKQIRVTRKYKAPVQLVWDAWTKSEMLDKWWAPLPYKNTTKSMDFREGGKWHYFMTSPAGEKHYCLFFYEKINKGKSYEGKDAFCDENAVPTNAMPSMHWKNHFEKDGQNTMVNIAIDFASEADLETIVKMGFKEGFEMGLNQLEDLLGKN